MEHPGLFGFLNVLFKNEKVRQRSGEVVDAGGDFRLGFGVCRHGLEHLPGLGFAAEFAQGERLENGQLGKRSHGHALEVARLGGSSFEFRESFGFAAERAKRLALPIGHIGLRLQEMVFLAEAVGGFHGEIEMLQSFFGVTSGQRSLAQQESSCGVLAEHLALAALPWMETSGGEQIERLLWLAGLIVERCEFDCGVVPFQYERAVSLQKLETVFSAVAELGAELHEFGDQPRIVWVAGEGFFIARASGGGIAAGIPIGNA